MIEPIKLVFALPAALLLLAIAPAMAGVSATPETRTFSAPTFTKLTH